MYVVWILVCLFVLFLLSIVLSIIIRLTDSDYLPLVSLNSSSVVLFSLSLFCVTCPNVACVSGLSTVDCPSVFCVICKLTRYERSSLFTE